MEVFIKYLEQFGMLNARQMELIMSKGNVRYVQKEEYLSKAGRIPKTIAFILEGVFRFCYHNHRGEEITSYFVSENRFVTDYISFESETESTENLQAATQAKVLLFNKKDWDDLLQTITGWDKIVNKIVQKCLIDKVNARSPLITEDATARYLNFMGQFPLLVNRVPLSYIASYLGITQQSLSRIRKNI